jgi:hypothetical protein
MLKRIIKIFIFGFYILGVGNRIFNEKVAIRKESIPTKNDNILDYKSFIKDVSEDSGSFIEDALASCFSGDTLVATSIEHGKIVTIPISSIQEGDYVLAMDFDRGALVKNRVSRLSQHASREYRFVEIVSASGNTFFATENHPIIINTRNIGIPARDLEVGQKILIVSPNGEIMWDKVDGLRQFTITLPVYNIEAENSPHNYLISSPAGGGLLLVHNGCCIK